MSTALVLARDLEQWERGALAAVRLANAADARQRAAISLAEICKAQETAHAFVVQCARVGVPVPPDITELIHKVADVRARADEVAVKIELSATIARHGLRRL